jgi:hypothetical protein
MRSSAKPRTVIANKKSLLYLGLFLASAVALLIPGLILTTPLWWLQLALQNSLHVPLNVSNLAVMVSMAAIYGAIFWPTIKLFERLKLVTKVDHVVRGSLVAGAIVLLGFIIEVTYDLPINATVANLAPSLDPNFVYQSFLFIAFNLIYVGVALALRVKTPARPQR